MSYSVSFTGHRLQKLGFFGEDDPMLVELKNRLYGAVSALIAEGADSFYTGMALGVDIWAAEIVLGLRKIHPQIKLTALVPCPEQDKLWDDAQKKRYREILGLCDNVVTVCAQYEKGCMHKRDRELVNRCDVLAAVFDEKNVKKGGTYYTVQYARSKGKKVIIIPPM